MSIRSGLYAASTLLATFVTGYVLYAILTDQVYLLDIGWLLLAINPYYWAATGKVKKRFSNQNLRSFYN